MLLGTTSKSSILTDLDRVGKLTAFGALYFGIDSELVDDGKVARVSDDCGACAAAEGEGLRADGEGKGHGLLI